MAVLLEGPPGTGKSSIIAALAARCGRELVRINISEQTEIADLVGQFLPAAGQGGHEVSIDFIVTL